MQTFEWHGFNTAFPTLATVIKPSLFIWLTFGTFQSVFFSLLYRLQGFRYFVQPLSLYDLKGNKRKHVLHTTSVAKIPRNTYNRTVNYIMLKDFIVIARGSKRSAVHKLLLKMPCANLQNLPIIRLVFEIVVAIPPLDVSIKDSSLLRIRRVCASTYFAHWLPPRRWCLTWKLNTDIKPLACFNSIKFFSLAIKVIRTACNRTQSILPFGGACI